MTRRSEWFVSKTPEVTLGARRLDYLISFALPRFSDQRLETRASASIIRAPNRGSRSSIRWCTSCITSIPLKTGLRQMVRNDGTNAHRCHSPEFFHGSRLARPPVSVDESRPWDVDFLRYDFDELTARYGRVIGTAFRGFPSYPRLYSRASRGAAGLGARGPRHIDRRDELPERRRRYSEADLDLRSSSTRARAARSSAPRKKPRNTHQSEDAPRFEEAFRPVASRERFYPDFTARVRRVDEPIRTERDADVRRARGRRCGRRQVAGPHLRDLSACPRPPGRPRSAAPTRPAARTRSRRSRCSRSRWTGSAPPKRYGVPTKWMAVESRLCISGDGVSSAGEMVDGSIA